MAGITLVFDFDKTIINCDSDNWVIDDLGGTLRFDELLLTMPWNSAMDKIMGEFHELGRAAEEIAAALRSAPLNPCTISAIKSAYALGCELRVVSDANRFFIETILKHHGLMEYFHEINTNPGFIDEYGRLRISPYHDFHFEQHGCPLCPPNMCKGRIIERIQNEVKAEGKRRFIYLGDGKGDFCPSLKLTENDYMMPRKDFPVWELICGNKELIRAEIHEWSDFKEQALVLLQLITKCISENLKAATAELVAPDRSFHAIPLSMQEALPKVLRVPH